MTTARSGSVRTGALVVAALATFALAALPASAQKPAKDEDTIEAARGHFDNGQDLYEAGKFLDAAAEFLAAYNVKPIPIFLFNTAVCHEKAGELEQAIAFFRRYLAEDPRARDRRDVEKRIAALEAERDRRRKAPPPETQPATQPATGERPPAPPMPPPAALPEMKPRGIVLIESKPPGATIYLDDKKSGPLGVTPWNGPLEGGHEIILESKGYKTDRSKITASADKMVMVIVALSEEHYLGWLEVRANVPRADVYLDGKASGPVGRTPFMGNVTPGKHTVIVTKEGFTEHRQELEIERGKAHKVEARLERAPIGFVAVRGASTDGATVRLDGKVVCKAAPCRFQAPQGRHTLEVRRPGRKPYRRKLEIGAATETTVAVKLAPRPSRAGAYWNFGFALAFIGGGVALGLQSSAVHDELRRDIDAGMPPVHPDDGRFLRGKLFAYGADALYVIGGITAISGVVGLLREKGPASVGTATTRDLGTGAAASSRPELVPDVRPGYAGIAAEVRW